MQTILKLTLLIGVIAITLPSSAQTIDTLYGNGKTYLQKTITWTDTIDDSFENVLITANKKITRTQIDSFPNVLSHSEARRWLLTDRATRVINDSSWVNKALPITRIKKGRTEEYRRENGFEPEVEPFIYQRTFVIGIVFMSLLLLMNILAGFFYNKEFEKPFFKKPIVFIIIQLILGGISVATFQQVYILVEVLDVYFTFCTIILVLATFFGFLAKSPVMTLYFFTFGGLALLIAVSYFGVHTGFIDYRYVDFTEEQFFNLMVYIASCFLLSILIAFLRTKKEWLHEVFVKRSYVTINRENPQ